MQKAKIMELLNRAEVAVRKARAANTDNIVNCRNRNQRWRRSAIGIAEIEFVNDLQRQLDVLENEIQVVRGQVNMQ
jgi:hypothetical protein